MVEIRQTSDRDRRKRDGRRSDVSDGYPGDRGGAAGRRGGEKRDLRRRGAAAELFPRRGSGPRIRPHARGRRQARLGPRDLGDHETRQPAPGPCDAPRRGHGPFRRGRAGLRRHCALARAHEPDPGDRPREPGGRGGARRRDQRDRQGGPGVRPFLCRLPDESRDLLHRGQRGRERGRRPGHQVRRHGALRARPRGRPAHRRDRPDGRQAGQGRHRLRPHPPAGRLGGHAGHLHEDHPAASSPACGHGGPAGPLRQRLGSHRGVPESDYRCRDYADVHRVHGPPLRGHGLPVPGRESPAAGHRGHAAHRAGRVEPGAGRRGEPEDRGALPADGRPRCLRGQHAHDGEEDVGPPGESRRGLQDGLSRTEHRRHRGPHGADPRSHPRAGSPGAEVRRRDPLLRPRGGRQPSRHPRQEAGNRDGGLEEETSPHPHGALRDRLSPRRDHQRRARHRLEAGRLYAHRHEPRADLPPEEDQTGLRPPEYPQSRQNLSVKKRKRGPAGSSCEERPAPFYCLTPRAAVCPGVLPSTLLDPPVAPKEDVGPVRHGRRVDPDPAGVHPARGAACRHEQVRRVRAGIVGDHRSRGDAPPEAHALRRARHDTRAPDKINPVEFTRSARTAGAGPPCIGGEGGEVDDPAEDRRIAQHFLPGARQADIPALPGVVVRISARGDVDQVGQRQGGRRIGILHGIEFVRNGGARHIHLVAGAPEDPEVSFGVLGHRGDRVDGARRARKEAPARPVCRIAGGAAVIRAELEAPHRPAEIADVDPVDVAVVIRVDHGRRARQGRAHVGVALQGIAPEDASVGKVDDEEALPPLVAVRCCAGGKVVPAPHEADPLLAAVDLHPAHVDLAPGLAQVGRLGRSRVDPPSVGGRGGGVRDVQGVVAAVVGVGRRVAAVEAGGAGGRGAPEVAHGAASFAEDQKRPPVREELCRGDARRACRQPHVGHRDGAVDKVLVGKPRRVRLVGDVLELVQEVRRDEAPGLAPVDGLEGVKLAVVGPGHDDPLAVDRGPQVG